VLLLLVEEVAAVVEGAMMIMERMGSIGVTETGRETAAEAAICGGAGGAWQAAGSK
jgi:hypothetical protein